MIWSSLLNNQTSKALQQRNLHPLKKKVSYHSECFLKEKYSFNYIYPESAHLLLSWIRLYLPASFNLQPAVASLSFQIDGTASQWLCNFKFSSGSPGILCLLTPRGRLLQSTLHWLYSKAENRVRCFICSPGKKLLQDTGSCFAVHLWRLSRGLETRSVLKIKKTSPA